MISEAHQVTNHDNMQTASLNGSGYYTQLEPQNMIKHRQNRDMSASSIFDNEYRLHNKSTVSSQHKKKTQTNSRKYSSHTFNLTLRHSQHSCEKHDCTLNWAPITQGNYPDSPWNKRCSGALTLPKSFFQGCIPFHIYSVTLMSLNEDTVQCGGQ